MEELIYKLEVITSIKQAISNTYCELEDANTYYECMEWVNDVEKDIVMDLVKF